MKGKSILETAAVILGILVLYAVLLVSCENSIIYHPYKYPEGEWNLDYSNFKLSLCLRQFCAPHGRKPSKNDRSIWSYWIV